MRWKSAILTLGLLGISSLPSAGACSWRLDEGWEQREIEWADEIFVGKLIDTRRSDYADWIELKLSGLVRRVTGRLADDNMFRHDGYLITKWERIHAVKGDAEPTIVEVWFSQYTTCDDRFVVEPGELTLVAVKKRPSRPNATIPWPEVISVIPDETVQTLHRDGKLAGLQPAKN